jgi:transposase
MNTLRLQEELSCDEFRKRLKRADRRTAERLHAMYMRSKGLTPPEIAKITGKHVATIRRWIKAYNKAGISAMEYKHSGGPTRKLLREHEEEIIRLLRMGKPDGRWTLEQLSEEIHKKFGIKISYQQLSIRIHKLGLKPLMSARKTGAKK